MQVRAISLFVLVIAAFVFAGCSGSSPGGNATGQAVEIKNMAFNPANLTVKKGTAVTWTNKDGATHTVTKDAGQTDGPASGSVVANAKYTYTFNQVGTFTYHCDPHPNMKASITVTA